MNKRARFFIIAGLVALAIIFVLDLILMRAGNEYDWADLLFNILVESHGMLFDIVLFGILLAIYEGILEKKRTREKAIEDRAGQISRYQEEIDDFRGWHEKEATYRIVGNIRRLNQLGVSEINLEDCFLRKANLKGANLSQAKLRKANLDGANLQGANLEEANLNGAVLHLTNLQGANLRYANLKGVNFVEGQSLIRSVSLMKSNLDKADLRGVILDQTRLEGINLAGAILLESQRNILARTGADISHTVFQADEVLRR